MPRTLDFKSNFNNKLGCSTFVFIRPHSEFNERSLRDGAFINVSLCDRFQFSADILYAESMTWSQIPPMLIAIDLGYPKFEAEKFVAKMFKITVDDLQSKMFVVGVAKRVKFDPKKGEEPAAI